MKLQTVDPHELFPVVHKKQKQAVRRTLETVPLERMNPRRDYGLPEPRFMHLRRFDSEGKVVNDGGVTIAYWHNKVTNDIRFAYARCPGGVNYSKKKGRLTSGGRYVSKRQSTTLHWDPTNGDEADPLEYLIEEVKDDIFSHAPGLGGLTNRIL